MKEKKVKIRRYPDFDLVPNSSGIILDSIWIKKDKSEIKIVSAFGGVWTFRPLEENEESL